MKHRSLLRLIFVAAAVCLLGGIFVFGQGRIVGSISGAIEDANGAAVPNARVSLKDTKTGLTKETTSTENGTFFFPDLAIGAYEVTITASGFRRTLITNIAVSTGQTTDVKANLAVGQPEATVTVSSDTG